MAKKPKEKEMELEVTKQESKETFASRWFKEYAVNNATELKIICDLTARSADEQFYMKVASGNTEIYSVIFYATFLSILEFIKGKQSHYDDFTIAIANSINLGYTNNSNEDNEKIGNFMPIMEHIGINRNIIDDSSDIDSDRTSQNFIRWKQLNTKKNVEFYKEIQERAYEKIKKEYRINLRVSESVIPLFCIFMDHISNVIKLKFQESAGTDVSEVGMNVLGLFDVFYSFDESENKEVIEYQPNIMMKLALKSDSKASRG